MLFDLPQWKLWEYFGFHLCAKCPNGTFITAIKIDVKFVVLIAKLAFKLLFIVQLVNMIGFPKFHTSRTYFDFIFEE